MDKTFVKSKITLEEVRPRISNIHAYFGVPFDDGGFMMTEQEIKKAKKEFDEAFTNTVALILGITKEEAKAKIKTKKERGYWCWKHNVEYYVDIKTSKKPITFSARMHDNQRVTLDVNGEGSHCISYFELTQNGDIYQSPKTINEINSVEDILKKINKEKRDKLTKELKKLKGYEKKAAKGLETTRNKIKTLKNELEKYK